MAEGSTGLQRRILGYNEVGGGTRLRGAAAMTRQEDTLMDRWLQPIPLMPAKERIT